MLHLKPGKEKAIKNRHHWIFSGAIQQLPEFKNGDFLPVHSAAGELLGSAYFNRHSNIIGRMVSFDATPPLEAIKLSLDKSIAFRKNTLQLPQTSAYRLVNGEGDFLPGLIADYYDGHLVLQISTLGMDLLRQWLVEYFSTKLSLKSIYEKSGSPSRKQEGLNPVQKLLWGNFSEETTVLENGLKFVVPIAEGQKTGFFLDHREMREWVRSLAKGKNVLNCFSYTGAFSVYAASGGALKADSIDISDKAIQMAKRNFELNEMSIKDHQFIVGDVFDFLRKQQPFPYNFVILDPPAFAKKQQEVNAACRGYKDINRIAISKMPPGSLLLTSSCSHFVDEQLFKTVLFQASVEAKRKVRIIGSHRMAQDHPINIFHPETNYLKSFLLFIE